jgi:hypothetical protein
MCNGREVAETITASSRDQHLRDRHLATKSFTLNMLSKSNADDLRRLPWLWSPLGRLDGVRGAGVRGRLGASTIDSSDAGTSRMLQASGQGVPSINGPMRFQKQEG